MNEVWRASINHVEIDPISLELGPLLCPSERARLEKFTRTGRRKQYLVSRAMIRAALSRFYALPLSYWHLHENKDAPPKISNTPEQPLYISLSHSADCIMLAISQQPVGIDVENISGDRPLTEIAKRVFTPEQQAALSAMPSEQAVLHFYNLWTRKEALVKLADKPTSIQMFSNMAWETDSYHSAHTEFADFYASIISQKNIAQFDCYEFKDFKQINKTRIF